MSWPNQVAYRKILKNKGFRCLTAAHTCLSFFFRLQILQVSRLNILKYSFLWTVFYFQWSVLEWFVRIRSCPELVSILGDLYYLHRGRLFLTAKAIYVLTHYYLSYLWNKPISIIFFLWESKKNKFELDIAIPFFQYDIVVMKIFYLMLFMVFSEHS